MLRVIENHTLGTVTLFALGKKNLGKEYDKEEILRFIKKTKKIYHYENYLLYQLLEITSYLQTAYNQVQELVDNLEPDVAAKFLSYPIPSAILEEWEKVK